MTRKRIVESYVGEAYDKIKLVADNIDTIIDVAQNYAAVKGDKGDTGRAFRFEDFTPEQLATLKGEKGDLPIKGVDFIDGTPGDKGDPGITPIKGVDYFDGRNGLFTSFIYYTGSSSPARPTGGSFDGETEIIPVGWTDDPVAPSHATHRVYMAKAIYEHNVGNDTWSRKVDWSEPVDVTGADGYTPQKGVDYFDGVNSKYTSFIFRNDSVQPFTPTGGTFHPDVGEVIPTGWTDDLVEPTGGQHTWMSHTIYRLNENNGLWEKAGWSNPIKASTSLTRDNVLDALGWDTTPTQPTNVIITPLFNTVGIMWDIVNEDWYLQTNIYRQILDSDDQVPDINLATKIGSTSIGTFVDSIGANTIAVYWLKHENKKNVEGIAHAALGTKVTTKVDPSTALQGVSDDIRSNPNYQWLQSSIGFLDTINRLRNGAGFGTTDDDPLVQKQLQDKAIIEQMAEDSLVEVLNNYNNVQAIKIREGANYVKLSGGVNAAVDADAAYIQRIQTLESKWTNELGNTIDGKISDYDEILTGDNGVIATRVNAVDTKYQGVTDSLNNSIVTTNSNHTNLLTTLSNGEQSISEGLTKFSADYTTTLFDGETPIKLFTKAQMDTISSANADANGAIAYLVENLEVSFDGNTATLQELASVKANAEGLSAQWGVKTSIGGINSGIGLYQWTTDDVIKSSFLIQVDNFALIPPSSAALTDEQLQAKLEDETGSLLPFVYSTDTGTVHIKKAAMVEADITDLWATNVIAAGISVAAGEPEAGIIKGLALKGGSIAIGGASFDQFSVDSTGLVDIKKGSINLGNGVFTVSNTGAVVATDLTIKRINPDDSETIILTTSGIPSSALADTDFLSDYALEDDIPNSLADLDSTANDKLNGIDAGANKTTIEYVKGVITEDYIKEFANATYIQSLVTDNFLATKVWAGALDVGDHFAVDIEGKVVASDVDITGKITATSGSFTGAITATSGSFTGTITATSGTFNSGTLTNCTISENCTVEGTLKVNQLEGDIYEAKVYDFSANKIIGRDSTTLVVGEITLTAEDIDKYLWLNNVRLIYTGDWDDYYGENTPITVKLKVGSTTIETFSWLHKPGDRDDPINIVFKPVEVPKGTSKTVKVELTYNGVATDSEAYIQYVFASAFNSGSSLS